MSSKLDKQLVELGFTKEPFNTCNAWGFGGGVGHSYKKGDIKVKIGTAYYRHANAEKYITLYDKDSISGRAISQKGLHEYLNIHGYKETLKSMEKEPIHRGMGIYL